MKIINLLKLLKKRKKTNEEEIIIDDEIKMNDKKNSFKSSFSNFTKKTRNTLLILYIIFVFASYYVLLVPINPFSKAFYIYFIFLLAILSFIFFIDSFNNNASKKIYKFISKIIILVFAIIVISNVYSLPIFHAKTYSTLLVPETSDFAKDVAPADFSTLPVVDKSTAIKLGGRKMGEMGNLVSQYDIDETYSQICVKGKPIRVTPLVYANIVKWFFNQKNGIPYYIKIDMATQDADLYKLEKPIKYSFSDKFGRDIVRHIRFKYPTKLTGEINFETDEEGHPFWITPVLQPKVGLFNGYDVKETIIVDAVTGEIKLFNKNEVPEWLDRVYPADMVNKQLVDNGLYSGGFLNSLINQVGVTRPTAGYNYLTIGNDIYLYTGITSILEDASNIGFVFVNMRTKETKFYQVSSAEEFSVMDSAAGAVQEKGYNSTFPILINLNSRPTYFMALKDNADLTKMFALVDAQNYQKVAVGNSVEETTRNYKNITTEYEKEDKNQEKTKITIKDIKETVINGNTTYLFTANENDLIYVADININKKLAFTKIGDTLEITGVNTDGFFTITNIK